MVWKRPLAGLKVYRKIVPPSRLLWAILKNCKGPTLLWNLGIDGPEHTHLTTRYTTLAIAIYQATNSYIPHVSSTNIIHSS